MKLRTTVLGVHPSVARVDCLCIVAQNNLLLHPTIGDLTPRQYERLFLAIEEVQRAVREFKHAYEVLAANTTTVESERAK